MVKLKWKLKKKYLKTVSNENTTIQNLQGVAKTFLKGKLIAIQEFLIKTKTQGKQTNQLPKRIRIRMNIT